MRLTKVYIRFFRSFNHDYERKAIGEERPEWEKIDGVWYPFIRVPLEPTVTAVVGANESGKTHLIDAIKQALTGVKIDHGDFCRYSDQHSVETGARRKPDLGVEFALESEADLAALPQMDTEPAIGGRLALLRLGDDRVLLIARNGQEKALTAKMLEKLEARLPRYLELETNVPLPDRISFDALLGREFSPLNDREGWFGLSDFFRNLGSTDAESVSNGSEALSNLLTEASERDAQLRKRETKSAELAQSLLLKVAQIDRSAFEELEQRLRAGSEGTVGGLIEKMNRALETHLNFSRWWTQDPDFHLQLEPRERELVFIIRDKTETKYSFDERSKGLSYFLSYFVQLQAHRSSPERLQQPDRPEILLMDEPDAYLSSVGQQDLLRALEDFAEPTGAPMRDQVVYVTHSPFLINRNAAHRIRVLDKGTDQEGTRVVKDVSRNHYEPLRSSIGANVAETAFIGGSNLLVEGPADQVLLTSLTTLLRHRQIGRSRLLDLNETTIVPCGSASAVPYMAYVARGRDELKPACIALLDGDQAGREAIARIARGDGIKGRAILNRDYVLDLGHWAVDQDLKVAAGVSVVELEDLIPLPLAVQAARSYAVAMLRVSAKEVESFTAEGVLAELATAPGLWPAISSHFASAFDGGHIEKVGFAKELALQLEHDRDLRPPPDGLADLEHNFGLLIATLADLLSAAEADEASRRTNRRSDRIIKTFLEDFPSEVSRDTAFVRLRELEKSLESTAGDDAVRAAIGDIRRSFELVKDPLEPVEDFERFRERLAGLRVVRRDAYRKTGQASAEERLAATD
jgi:predicted ATPase